MTCWVIDHGVPFDVAHALDEGQLLAYAIVFTLLQEPNSEWDWDAMTFLRNG
jgi:hypothetical protein